MRGHIAKKGERYYAVISVTDPRTGARKRRWEGGFVRKKDAEKALTVLLDSLDRGVYIEPSKQTVGEYLSEWLEGVRMRVRASTWDSYRSNIETHVVPQLGSLRIGELAASHLNRLYNELLTSGRADGAGGLSARTVRYIHTILRRAFKDAVRRRKLTINPVDLADAPSASAAKAPEMKVWSIKELRRFLKHVRRDRLQAAYVLTATTGMRRGEVVGLRWSDVDFDKGLVAIRQTLIVVDYKVQVSEPKTKRSRRTIPIDPATVAALKSWRAVQTEERLAWGPAWTDTGLVFTREDGTALNPQMLSDAFERQAKGAGLPAIRYHDYADLRVMPIAGRGRCQVS